MHGATLLLLAALALGCGGGEQQAEPPPEAMPPRSASAAAPAEPLANAPSRGAIATAPDGASLYALYCASCHGARGDGDGPVAQALDPRPARHSDGHYMNGLSDDYLFRVISEGGAAVGKSPLMAPWSGTLDAAQIRALVTFIRTLPDPPNQPG